MKRFNFKKFLPILAILAMIVLITAMPMAIHADFGDYAGDNDYGWDDGGGDWDSSNSSDGAGALIDLIFWVYHLFGFKGVVVLLIILAVARGMYRRKRDIGRPPVQTAVQRTNTSDLKPMHTYIALDPQFSEGAFTEKLSNMYVRFQNSWEAKDMSDLRPYLTDAMFAQCDRQLDAYRRNGQTNHIERISVLGVKLSGWKQDGGNDVIIAELNTRIVDYVTEDATNKLVRGSRTAEKFMTYEWTLVRTSGQVTGSAAGMTGQTCPYCGAHIDINHTAKCEYCDAVLTTDTFDWVVSNIKGLSQKTVG
ncbi:MAG: Tim44 domain-containing protein [Oscillospiraceae bacterium]|nr:Tim44 domain-containing protein [Oscillospiraceae bacterium]